jgi:hypothetical protein
MVAKVINLHIQNHNKENHKRNQSIATITQEGDVQNKAFN